MRRRKADQQKRDLLLDHQRRKEEYGEDDEEEEKDEDNNVDALSKNELKVRLRKLALKMTGNKATLRTRFKEVLKKDATE